MGLLQGGRQVNDEEREYLNEMIRSLNNQLIDALRERDEANANAKLYRDERDVMEQSIGNASMLLADWDGYYNPQTKRGNAEELAKLIEEAYTVLQGRSWRDQED
jgi:hypothetical protein